MGHTNGANEHGSPELGDDSSQRGTSTNTPAENVSTEQKPSQELKKDDKSFDRKVGEKGKKI